MVKYGGHAMVDASLRESFARDIVLMKFVGLHPVVVHGGGPQIDQMLCELGAQSERVEGLRITDDQTMKVVEMVLGAQVNQEIVSLIGKHGGRAVGLTGRDDGFVRAEKVDRMTTRSGKLVDPGRVGAVQSVNPAVLHQLIDGGIVPVIAPIAVDADGHSLNVNADTVAGEVAKALSAAKLVLMTDIEGVKNGAGEIQSSLTSEQVDELIGAGVIEGGMIPKVGCATDALAGGVSKTHIIDGRKKHAVLLEIFTDQGIGTQITL